MEKKNSKKKIIAIIALMGIIVAAVLALRSCSVPEKMDKNVADGTMLTENGNVELADGETAIPVIEDFTVTKDLPTANVYNPAVNKDNSFLSYKFVNADTDEIIYETELIKPGEYVGIDFGKILDKGTYNVDIDINSFSYEDSSVQKNGAKSTVVVTIK